MEFDSMTETDEKICWILVGLPGVGKSTWVRNTIPEELFTTIDETDLLISGDVDWLSTDKLIEAEAAAKGKTYNEVFGYMVKKADKAFWLSLETTEAPLVIVDRTNLTVGGRAKIIRIMKDKGYKIRAAVFTVDNEEHKRRLASRPGKTIPEHVIWQMKGSYVEPTVDEGFERIVMYS